MNKIFKDHIGRNIKVYVDGMIVKSKSFEEHVEDLEKIFFVLSHYQMKLNPAKRAFFIKGGKFLG